MGALSSSLVCRAGPVSNIYKQLEYLFNSENLDLIGSF